MQLGARALLFVDPREDLEAVDDASDPLRAGLRFGGDLVELVERGLRELACEGPQLFAQRIEIGEDVGERVVDPMSDAGGERDDRRELSHRSEGRVSRGGARDRAELDERGLSVDAHAGGGCAHRDRRTVRTTPANVDRGEGRGLGGEITSAGRDEGAIVFVQELFEQAAVQRSHLREAEGDGERGVRVQHPTRSMRHGGDRKRVDEAPRVGCHASILRGFLSTQNEPLRVAVNP